MNKTMKSIMKPIPVGKTCGKASLRQAQEDRVLSWLQTVPNSVNCVDVANLCGDIPGVDSRWIGGMERRQCSAILKRLERKGFVVSTLYGSYRYYSIPEENGGEN